MKALKIIGKIAATYWFANATAITIAYFGHKSGEDAKRFYKKHGRYPNKEEIHEMMGDDFINGCEILGKLIKYKLSK